jgi:hypothetical protein
LDFNNSYQTAQLSGNSFLVQTLHLVQPFDKFVNPFEEYHPFQNLKSRKTGNNLHREHWGKPKQ